MTMQLRKATRQKAKIRLGLSAASGGGKTISALLIAYGICGDWDKIALIDTENGSADLYANHTLSNGVKIGEFNVLPLLPDYSPERYIQAIRSCESAGMEVVIIDSITHEWDGEGGILRIADNMTGDNFSKWKVLTPRHDAFKNAILESTCHVITTVRRKQEFALVKDEGSGKNKVEKLGLKEITRDGFDYELTINLELDQNHNSQVGKDRTGLFAGKPSFVPSIETGRIIAEWCESGIDVSTELNESIARIADCANPDELELLTSTQTLLVSQHPAFVDAVNARMNGFRMKEAVAKAKEYELQISQAPSPEALSELPAKVNALPQPHKDNLRQFIAKKAKDNGWQWDADSNSFKAAPSGQPTNGAPAAASTSNDQGQASASTNTAQSTHDDAGLISAIHNATTPDHLTNIEKVYGAKINESPALLQLFTDRYQVLMTEYNSQAAAIASAPATNQAPPQVNSSAAAPAKVEEKTNEELIEEFKPKINGVTTPEALTDMLEQVNKLPNDAAKALRRTVAAKAKNSGWLSNKESGKFELDPAKAAEESKGDQDQAPKTDPPVSDAKKEDAPAAPIAQSQKIEWFAERSGKKVWWQGKPGEYTGVYEIPAGDHIPAWLHGTIQGAGGTMFRDLTESEAAA